MSTNGGFMEAHDSANGPGRKPRVELLTSPGCHLCDQARIDLASVTDPLGITVHEINVEDHLDLLKQHAEEIPVVRIDGVPRDFWRVDTVRISRILRGILEGHDPEEG
ncbi:glutaredoxin family protein [uncultured Kocuria sp.]|uniref:glutaredoxin family protein n=1 Tax=uncultured Kocuria sp. TaxID=259305 RepID=UPI002598AECE|nr:glutaredoxin family protein [uncultured Kocuria sp.]